MVHTIFYSVVVLSACLLLVSIILAGVRIMRGPTPADRVVALDMLGLLGASATGIAALTSGYMGFLDIALCVTLMSFLTTIAFAAFIDRGAIQED